MISLMADRDPYATIERDANEINRVRSMRNTFNERKKTLKSEKRGKQKGNGAVEDEEDGGRNTTRDQDGSDADGQNGTRT